MADPAKPQQPTQEQIVEEDEFEEFEAEGEPELCGGACVVCKGVGAGVDVGPE